MTEGLTGDIFKTNLDLSKIDQYFPMDKYRPGQKKAIENILTAFNDGKKIVILEAPTGSGKSAIGFTIAQFFKSSFIVTPQKMLQDQYMSDFGYGGKRLGKLEPMVDLKGRNAYPCNYWDNKLSSGEQLPEEKRKKYAELSFKKLGCDKGECKRQNKGKLEECVDPTITCPYFQRLYEAMAARVCLMNFHSFLFQTGIVRQFGIRDLLIIDECLHPHTYIITEYGRIAIGNIVNKQIRCKVLSYNTLSCELEYKPITRWLRRSKQQTYKVLAGNRVFYATLDHKIYCPSGKRPLRELSVGDQVLINESEINSTQRQLILGSLLGDASLHILPFRHKKDKHIYKGIRARIRFQHGPKQFWYIDWKYNIIKEHVRTKPKICKTPKSFTKTIKKFSTKCNIYSIIKDLIGNNKTVTEQWLNEINEFGLAIWFMDDGSRTKTTSIFHTEGFSKTENKKIKKWLCKRWGIIANLYHYFKRNKKLYYLSLRKDDSIKLNNIIAKFIPPRMRYKLLYGYNWPDYDDSIESIRSKPISVQSILHISRYKEETTYDLEVADNHNYFAGSTLVSNCHNTESVLMKFIEVNISDRNLAPYGIKIPELQTVKEYIDYFINVNIIDILSKRQETAIANEDLQEVDEIKNTKTRLEFLYKSDPTRWISIYEENKSKSSRTISIKPIFVNDYARQYLFNMANHILIMSATILNKKIICESLGIHEEEVTSLRLPSTFPVKNRPIYHRPCGSMSFKNKADTLPKMLDEVNNICEHHKDERGIIHTHTFEITKYILDNCSIDTKNRLLFQNQTEFSGNKSILMEKHKSINNSIIIAPAMHEGVDLYDDLGRFQLICKVPYPSLKDPQIAARMKLSQSYFDFLSCLKISQSYGRIYRHMDDWGVTYILDSDFKFFYKKCFDMLPKWFTEAIIWE